jgi:hypothetical protein
VTAEVVEYVAGIASVLALFAAFWLYVRGCARL